MHLSGLILKHIHKGIIGPNHIPRCRMHYAFRFARRARCIQNKQRIFSFHGFCGYIPIPFVCYPIHFVMPPKISSWLHGTCSFRALIYDDGCYGIGRFQSLIHDLFQRNILCTPVGSIAGYDTGCAGICDTIRYGLCRKPTENNGMNCSNASASQGGNG